jgi:hypothetical protein
VSAELPVTADWMIHPPKTRAGVYRSDDNREIVLSNGLIRRAFRIAPDAACVSFDNLVTGEALLRAVKPEALVVLDGTEYPIGGLLGQPDLAFLRPEWLDTMTSDPASFQFAGFTTANPEKRIEWKQVRHHEKHPWPPEGVALTLHFVAPDGKASGVTVDVHYEMYDGLPVVAKWISIHNGGSSAIRLNRFVSEIVGFVESESVVNPIGCWRVQNIYVASDYSFDGDTPENANHVAYWVTDPHYTSQVNYELKTPAVLECRPPLGPDVDIPAGGSLESFRVYELIHDSTDRERKGLQIRRLYRALAPWTTENPLMLHLTATDADHVKTALDQCAELGFEMVIFSFGSGLNMEDVSPENIAKFKGYADYAHARGLQIGGYSLLASRHISDDDDVLSPRTGKPGDARFGYSPCLGSHWGITYFEHLRTFLSGTGFDLLEHDGSYPGDVCASTAHPGHHGLEDSQWTQFQTIAEFYRWCRARGMFLNAPDWYFLAGSNKTGMGYREDNWSLPRDRQIILGRQNMYDGTWAKAPSMGWMFVPLVEYHGGGAAATIEPLDAHRDHYEAHLANDLGFGVQACYRGPRLYDTPATRALVEKWIRFFKRYRPLLESDIIHVRRADGRDLDAILHANPELPEKGLLAVYNPTNQSIKRHLTVPLYYTGISRHATIRHEDHEAHGYDLDREYHVTVEVEVPARGMTWYVITGV